MKAVQIALIGLLVVLAAGFFLYVDNREYNALVNGQELPIHKVPEEPPASISKASQKVKGTGIELSELYYRPYERESEEPTEEPSTGDLYFGIWYGKGNELTSDRETDWRREKGVVSFLVKAVDESGTTFNGKTTGKVDGTFSVFQFVKIEGYNFDEEGREAAGDLELFFYPVSKSGEPVEEALFETKVPLTW
ncbi:hypothetical protein [Halobacillus salinus]|uniref:Uncharacterized protein n=1 Tax=Halobacillus salinus TaxID=192814 RepID=A0A4Z0H696_9BACI|nr:hypothetical protein [Halobacillus salinus]TGB05354.1 hypothetical protein E4663_10295 [Halobacillus salinus]